MRILFLVSLVLATYANAQLVIESNGNHLFPDRLATGPTEFDLLDSDDIMARDGTLVYCENCPPGAPPSGPCTIGSQNCGAYCFRIEGVWVCSTEATCTAVGQDCVMDHECCTGVCTSGMCTVPISPTMCSPFICPLGSEQIGADSNCNPICGLEAGGGCTGSITTPPLEQRAVRTVTGTCSANWLPFCDVRNYGAVGDGTTDDSAAFTAAITACCNGGTVYVPRMPTFGAFYKVTQGFNNDESCFFNLLGDGATPNVEASSIHLTTPINTNCVTGPPRTCDALFDLSSGWIQDIALQGPNAFAVNPGVDNENSDGVHFAAYANRVEIKQFTTGLTYPNIIRNSTIVANFIGVLSPHEIWYSEMDTDNYANVFFDTFAVISSHHSHYNAAPYLWFGVNGASALRSDTDTFESYGNAGLSFAGHAVAGIRIEGTGGALTTGQNNLFKLPAVAVDNGVHLGNISNDVNRIEASDDFITQSGKCHIDSFTNGGSLRYIITNESAVEISVGCQIDSGSAASLTVCNNDETQCMPQAITTLGTGAALSPVEGATVYFVPTSATDVTIITPTVGGCTHFIGQRYTFIFTGTRKMKHEAVGTGCEIALQGGADFTAAAGNTLTVLHDGTRWREITRSTPPS